MGVSKSNYEWAQGVANSFNSTRDATTFNDRRVPQEKVPMPRRFYTPLNENPYERNQEMNKSTVKIVAQTFLAITGLAVGSIENKVAPRNTVYPTPKRLMVGVAGVFAMEYLITAISLVIAKKAKIDPQILFDKD